LGIFELLFDITPLFFAFLLVSVYFVPKGVIHPGAQNFLESPGCHSAKPVLSMVEGMRNPDTIYLWQSYAIQNTLHKQGSETSWI